MKHIIEVFLFLFVSVFTVASFLMLIEKVTSDASPPPYLSYWNHVEITLKVTLKIHVPYYECAPKDPPFCTSVQSQFITVIQIAMVVWNHKVNVTGFWTTVECYLVQHFECQNVISTLEMLGPNRYDNKMWQCSSRIRPFYVELQCMQLKINLHSTFFVINIDPSQLWNL